jgi:hypothetical protein
MYARAFRNAVVTPLAVADHPFVMTGETLPGYFRNSSNSFQQDDMQSSNADENSDDVSAISLDIAEQDKEHTECRALQALVALIPYAEQVPQELSSTGHHLGRNEYLSLLVFLRYVNYRTTVVRVSDLRRGVEEAHALVIELDNPARLANQALLWACVACGAVVRQSPLAESYLFIAKEYLRYSFDSPTQETFFALSATAYTSYLLDWESFQKYADLALIICLEIADSCTFGERRDCRMSMQLLRGHIMNDTPMNGEAWHKSVNEKVSFLDRTAWKEVIPDQTPNSINFGMRMWAQMADSLSKMKASPEVRSQSLNALRAICDDVRPVGNPVLEKLLHANRMLVHVCSGRMDEAAQAAKSLIKIFETYPMLLTLSRQPSATHMLLDSAHLLGDKLLRNRIAVVRSALKQVSRSRGEPSIVLSLYNAILAELFTRLPIATLTARHVNTASAESQMDDLEAQFAAEEDMLFRDSQSLFAPPEEWAHA